MERIERKARNRKIIFGVVFLIFLLVMAYIFPYSGDDWAWGSSIGLGRLHTWFADYNGRYLGNLLVMALTRSLFLKTIVIAGVLWGIVYLTDKYTNEHKESNLIFYVSALVLLALPRGILMQGVVWTAGFSNYVPPIFLIIIYLIVVNNIFKNEKPKYSKILIIPMFILAICIALFMEHVTLYSIVLGFFVMVYSLIKFRKLYAVHVAYFIGSLIGAFIMFSNSAYGIIAKNQGGYRSIAQSKTLFHSIFDAITGIIYRQLSFNNIVVNILLAICFIILICQYIKRNNKRKALGNVLGFVIVIYPIYSIIKLLNPSWDILLRYTGIFEAGLAILFYVVLIITVIFFIEDKNKIAKLLFLLLSQSVLTAPLFVVNPIGPRCFFPMYVIYMLIIGTLINEIDMSYDTSKVFGKIVTVAAIAFAIYIASIYGYIGKVNMERIKSVDTGIKHNATQIIIPELPENANCNFVWTSYPQSFWMDRFKLFYNIPEKTQVDVVTYQEWSTKYHNGKLKTYSTEKIKEHKDKK